MSEHHKAIGDSGRLRSSRQLPDSLVLGSDTNAARWLAYVGLGGRFAFRPYVGWVRHNGKGWRRSSLSEVRSAARVALHAYYDKRIEAGAPDPEVVALVRLLDVNWCWRLVELMRRLVEVNEVSA
ncbi:MAG: hypothetical protein OSB43_06620 [Nocardioides sp.]|uniref:hypothetical protein n=1 Tax=Nocardioides sp. TaxID=35761 RepID=UPI0023A27181|nr:hypothetical protein [Nocardioides sp.]MDE0775926.1 hypothetical protein [Nocardioides sp.]